MRVPDGMTEDQVLDTIEVVVQRLAPKFRIPGLGREDIEQEGRIFALELLEKGTYDVAVGPLEGYILTHVKRRYFNLKRDLVQRSDAPCQSCNQGQPCGPDGQVCERYAKWSRLQKRKTQVRFPGGIDNVTTADSERLMAADSAAESDAEVAEVLRLLDTQLDPDLRREWLRLRSGVALTGGVRRRVVAAVFAVLAEVGLRPEDLGIDAEDL